MVSNSYFHHNKQQFLRWNQTTATTAFTLWWSNFFRWQKQRISTKQHHQQHLHDCGQFSMTAKTEPKHNRKNSVNTISTTTDNNCLGHDGKWLTMTVMMEQNKITTTSFALWWLINDDSQKGKINSNNSIHTTASNCNNSIWMMDSIWWQLPRRNTTIFITTVKRKKKSVFHCCSCFLGGKVYYCKAGDNKINSDISSIKRSISFLHLCSEFFKFSGKESYYLFYLQSSFIQLLLWACETWLSVLISNLAPDSAKAGLRIGWYALSKWSTHCMLLVLLQR